MKKILLTSLFCGALIASSLANFSNNSQQAPIISNPLNRMVVVPGGGGDGGGGSGLPTYEEDYSKDTVNEFPYQAKAVGINGQIKGKIVLHTYDERTQALIDKVDKDYYKFSITENLRYNFELNAPNSSYYFKLFRYSSNYTYRSHDGHTLLYSSQNNSTTYSCILQPATYIILVTSSSESSVRPDSNYTLKMQRTENPYSVQSVQLSKEELKENSIFVWVNDNAPLNANRWKDREQNLCTYRNHQTITFYRNSGYVDPIYMANKDKIDYSDMSLDEKPTLDTITYISGTDNIKDVRLVADKIRDEISKEAARRECTAFNVEAKEIAWDAAKGAFHIVLTVFFTVFTGPAASCVSKTISTIRFYVNSIKTVVSACKAISFSNAPRNKFTDTDICANLSTLSAVCGEALENSNKILRIPRYSYLYTGAGDDKISNNDSYARSSKWLTSFMLPSPYLFSREYFIANKDSYIYRSQSHFVTDLGDYRTFKGSILKYKSLHEFWDSVTPEVEWSDYLWRSNGLLEYRMAKRSDDRHYLKIYNSTSFDQRVTYTTTTVTDKQASKFNCVRDPYCSVIVKSGEEVEVCIGDLNYTYVRENYDSSIRKITYTGWDAFIDSSCSFDHRFLKVAIIQKNSGVWTIRVRNLYSTDATVAYNSRMCFGWHAKEWSSSLTDIKYSYNLKPFDYVDVEISENGTAGYIAVSRVIGGTRYITSAAGLNQGGYLPELYETTVSA